MKRVPCPRYTNFLSTVWRYSGGKKLNTSKTSTQSQGIPELTIGDGLK